MASRKHSPKKSKRKNAGKHSSASFSRGKRASLSSSEAILAVKNLSEVQLKVVAEPSFDGDVVLKEKAKSLPLFSPVTGLLWCVFGGLLLGFSQPFLLESLGETPVFPDAAGWLSLIGFVPFAIVVHRQNMKFTFWHAVVTQWVQFSVAMWWLKVPIEVYTPLGSGVGWAAVFLLAFVGALMLATALTVARLISCRHGWDYGWVAAVAYCGVEFLRNHGFVGGFPWATLGNSLASVSILLQSASLFGVYGLVLMIMLVNMGLGSFIADRLRGEKEVSSSSKLGLATFVFSVAFGAFWLWSAPKPTDFVKVGLLQGNASRRYKDHRSVEKMPSVGKRFRKLQQEAIDKGAEIVVWPEASLPDHLTEKSTHLRGGKMLSKKLREKHISKKSLRHVSKSHSKMKQNVISDEKEKRILKERQRAMPKAAVIGATVSVEKTDPITGKKIRQHTNSAVVTTENLEIVGRFDKIHLVPFGEYVPWPLQSFVRRFVVGSSQPGKEFKVVDLPLDERRLKVATTICFEGVFPEITRAFAKQDADLFFNVTNDKWYGVSSMTYQHLRMYSLRAVESGRAIARVAITGISGWIDADGSLHDLTKHYVPAAVVADVPIYTRTPLYVLIGDVLPFSCAVFILLAWFLILLGDGFLSRERQSWQQFGGACFLLLILATLVWHYGLDDTPDESDSTLTFSLFVYGAMMGIGLWSNREWGIRTQKWTVGVTLFFTLLTLVIGESSSKVVMILLFICSFYFYRKSKKHPEAFTRLPSFFKRKDVLSSRKNTKK